jgi:predicted nucleic acid-binding protein
VGAQLYPADTANGLLRVLAYPKFRLTAADRETLLAEYLPQAEVVALPSPLPTLQVACRDSDDNIFLHLAVVSGADMLVSGDEDLAALSAMYPVVSPEALRDLLRRGSGALIRAATVAAIGSLRAAEVVGCGPWNLNLRRSSCVEIQLAAGMNVAPQHIEIARCPRA